MKKLYNILMSSFSARYAFLLTLIIAIWTLFSDLRESNIWSFHFLVSICCVFLIPLMINILFSALENFIRSEHTGDKDLVEMLYHRTGVEMSLRVLNVDSDIDSTHTYDLLFRQDMLNYDTDDFCSYRRISGVNTSKHTSSYLVYVETCDYAIKYEDIEIRAIDAKTKQELVVGCSYPKEDRRVQHSFRINFSNAIMPNEHFDIAFFIRIPLELVVLDKDKEINGISLVRIKNPVKKLVFNMCLSYKPRAVTMFGRKYNEKLHINDICELGGAITEEYHPQSELDKLFDIDWGANQPYIIHFEQDKPEYEQYIVRYIR